MLRVAALLAIAAAVVATPAQAGTIQCSYQNGMVLFHPGDVADAQLFTRITWQLQRISYGTGNAPGKVIGEWSGVALRARLRPVAGGWLGEGVQNGPAAIPGDQRRFAGDRCTAFYAARPIRDRRSDSVTPDDSGVNTMPGGRIFRNR